MPNPPEVSTESGREEVSVAGEFQRLMSPIAEAAKESETSSALNIPESFLQFLEALPAALYTTDAAGRITFYNEAAAELWGHRPEIGTDACRGSWKLYWPDGTFLPHGECPMAIALKEGRVIRGMEAAAERPDGVRVPFLAFPTPFFGPSGDVVGAVNMLVDITERKTAEIASQRLAAIIESSDDAILSKDLNGIITSWNRGAQRLFGYLAEEVIGKSVMTIIPPDRQVEEPDILTRIRRGERIDAYETVRRRKDGSLVDISLSISPIKDQNGKVIGASKIARDISERKAAEKFKDVLFGEMKHRVKNTLALAASISNQTFQSAPDDERQDFTARLIALANAHDALSRRSWEGACLTEIVARTLEPHQNGQIRIGGPEIEIDSGKAVAIALALHELATNATKYGALSETEGNVTVAWKFIEGQTNLVELSWREDGGPLVVAPARKGFGSRLIERALAVEFEKVELNFDPQGVVCTLLVLRSPDHT